MRDIAATHRSVEKALQILLLFIPDNSEMSIMDLSERLGVHRSTVSRLLRLLESLGFVQQNPGSRKFILGHSVVKLGSALNQSLSGHLTRIAIPHVDELRRKLGETVVFEVAGPKHTTIAHIAEGPGPIRIKGVVGERHWYHAAAGAKAVLAHCAADFQKRILHQELARFTPKTITDPEALKRHLKEVKRQGFAFDDEERNTEIRAFGCAIFDHDGTPVCAVAVAGPAHRIVWERRSEIVPELEKTAAAISGELHYRNDKASTTGRQKPRPAKRRERK